MTVRAARLAVIAVLAAAAPPLHAQVPGAPKSVIEPPSGIAPPTAPVRAARPVEFVGVPPKVVGFAADTEGFVDLEAIGPADVELRIRSVGAATLGGQPAASLVSLVAPAPVGGALGVPVLQPPRVPQPIAGSGTPIAATVKKRLRYAGVPGLRPTAPAMFDVVVEAAGGGATPKSITVRLVVGVDSGPPQIAFAGAGPATQPSFPNNERARRAGQPEVVPARRVEIHAKNFTLPPLGQQDAFRAVHQVVAEYADGAKFRVPFGLGTSAANVGPGVTVIVATVPNIKRGPFRIMLVTPLGSAKDTRLFEFDDNTYTASAGAFCGVNLVAVDNPASPPTEESLFTPISFTPKKLPATRSCDVLYGEWADADMTSAKIEPFGVVTAKMTRRPATGSLAHDGNMPAFSCNSAGIGAVTISWVAKLRIYVGECADRRVP